MKEYKENWFVRLLKHIGIIKEHTLDKAELCKAAQDICGHACESCYLRRDG